ncbi:hypothetical protein OQA88_7319 [Cercophora sp. LCS_1]
MTETLLSAFHTQKHSSQLTTLAADIKTHHAQTHPGAPDFASCPECYQKLLSTFRARYLEPARDEPEWFTSRRLFLPELESLLAAAEKYDIGPSAIDARIHEERIRWYAETFRSSVLRLMTEDPAGREAVLERLEDVPAEHGTLLGDISAILAKSDVISEEREGLEGAIEKIASAKAEERVEVLSEIFFAGAGTKGEAKYLDMLKGGLAMEQLIDRILEDQQAAVASKDQTEKLKQRLHELKRARAAHELQKKKREKKRARQAEQAEKAEHAGEVFEGLYDLPPCLVCAKAPDTAEFLQCPACAILVSYKAQEKPVVYCSLEHAEDVGVPLDIPASNGETDPTQPQHTEEAHACAAGGNCADPKNDRQPSPNASVSPCFCRECVELLHIPTMWCSSACADENFQRHREEVHMPARKRLNLIVTDRDRLEYFPPADGNPGEKTRYRPKDISQHIIPFQEAAKRWEDQNHVKFQPVERSEWSRQ